MLRKIIYLINPISGNKSKSPLQELIARKTIEHKIVFEFINTNAEGEYGFLKQKITKEGVTDIIICGGDGTVSAVASGLIGMDVRIGIIPAGSGNGLAFAAKIPKQHAKALDIVFKGNSAMIDGFYINDHFSCMLCGLGFDAGVAHAFAKQKKRGLQTYIKVSLIHYFKAATYPFKVILDERSLQADAFFINIANSNQFGNNVTIAPRAKLNDGLLDVVIVKKMSRFLLPFSILGQITGINALQNIHDYATKKNIIYFQASALTIHNPSQAMLHIDGDPAPTSKKFIIKTVRNAINLIQP